MFVAKRKTLISFVYIFKSSKSLNGNSLIQITEGTRYYLYD